MKLHIYRGKLSVFSFDQNKNYAKQNCLCEGRRHLTEKIDLVAFLTNKNREQGRTETFSVPVAHSLTLTVSAGNEEVSI